VTGRLPANGQRVPGFVRGGAVAFVMLIFSAATCLAQESSAPAPMPEDELTRVPVGQRPRPDFEPLGIRWGSLLIHPSVRTGVIYGSNIFATPQNPQHDLAVVASPGVVVRWETPTAGVKADIGADIYRYSRFSSQDRIDAHARVNTRREIARDLVFETAFAAARRHEVPGDASAPRDTKEPVPYHNLQGEAIITKTFNRFGIGVGAGVRNLTYEDVESIQGGTLDQTWRNGTILTATVKPFYELSPGYRVFSRLRANTCYFAGVCYRNRDSEGYDVRAGVDFALTPLIFGSVEAGYLSQSYDNPLIGPVDGISGGAKLTWLATPLMTVSLFADRAVAETAQQDVEARLDTKVGLKLDYELFRNLIISGGAEYTNQDFAGSIREDNVVKFSVGFDYLMNRSIEFGARYDYIDRSSTDPIYSYDSHVVMFNVTARH
jgi:hypothetical protein